MWDTESWAENDPGTGLQTELGFVDLKVGHDLAEALAGYGSEAGPWTEHGFETGSLAENGFEAGPLTGDGFELGPWSEHGFVAGPWTDDEFETGA